MKKAIFETGGKQYVVEPGSVIYVEKIDVPAGQEVEFSNVMMVNDVFGRPYVPGAKIIAKVLKHGKQKKIHIFKYNPKKKYRKMQGHRQPYTKLEILRLEA